MVCILVEDGMVQESDCFSCDAFVPRAKTRTTIDGSHILRCTNSGRFDISAIAIKIVVEDDKHVALNL